MDKENRKLPELEIHGTIFQFDIDSLLLIEKEKPYNTITFAYMEDHGTHYEFDYNPKTKNYSFINNFSNLDDLLEDLFEDKPTGQNEVQTIRVMLPRMAVMDTDGMCMKYDCTRKEIKAKTDFELIIDQEYYKRRLNGEVIKLNIAGHSYEVDALNNTLKSLNPEIKDVNLGLHFYDDIEDRYIIWCNLHTGEIESYKGDDENDDKLEFIFPGLYELDPIGIIQRFNLKSNLGLLYCDLKLEYEAEASSQIFNSEALLNKDFRVAQNDIKTIVLIQREDTKFIWYKYRGYDVACHKSGCLAVVYHHDSDPFDAHILISQKGTDCLSEAKLNIDNLIYPSNKLVTNKDCEFFTINEYLATITASYHEIYSAVKSKNFTLPLTKKKGPKLS